MDCQDDVDIECQKYMAGDSVWSNGDQLDATLGAFQRGVNALSTGCCPSLFYRYPGNATMAGQLHRRPRHPNPRFPSLNSPTGASPPPPPIFFKKTQRHLNINIEGDFALTPAVASRMDPEPGPGCGS